MRRALATMLAAILVAAAAGAACADTGFFVRASYGAGHPTLGEWKDFWEGIDDDGYYTCLLYTSPSPRD